MLWGWVRYVYIGQLTVRGAVRELPELHQRRELIGHLLQVMWPSTRSVDG